MRQATLKTPQDISKRLSNIKAITGMSIDLWAQISTRQRDEEDARKALERLKIVDEPIFYHHRRSRIELAFGRPLEARAEAFQAVQSENFPPFAVLCQLTVCEIELGHTEEAQELLSRLDRVFPRVRAGYPNWPKMQL